MLVGLYTNGQEDTNKLTWNSVELSSGEVLDLVCLSVLGIDGTDKHVVGDVVEVTTVLTCELALFLSFCGLKSNYLQPWTGHRNVVSGSLALGLDQNWKVRGILAVPRLEWLEDLETVGGWGDGNVDLRAVLWRSLVGVHTWVVSIGWKTVTGWSLELELLAVLVLEGVGERVEVESTSQGHGDNEIWRGDESVGSVVGIVATSEVTVVGRDDRVLLALLDVSTVPLA